MIRPYHLLCVLVVVSLARSQKYQSKYDNIDVDSILTNRRVLKSYLRCILDEGPCPPPAREFRTHIPDAISNNCARCTDAQVNIIRKTSRFIMRNNPDDWERISKKFDPQRKYRANFIKFLNAQ
uniref:Chemosensory protein 12 n=1 Tax=Chrysomela lapponica TaxID=153811 RepID=A0A310S3G9_CHRLA